MTREIKFRGKKTSNREWVSGNLVYSEELDAAIYFQVGNGKVKRMDFVYVDSDTIGQYTGLKDKNGKEIYEGDIIYVEYEDGSHTKVLVGWNKEEACFGIMNQYAYEAKLDGFNFPIFDSDLLFKFRKGAMKFEVIGNIHDNPELLNNKTEEL